MELHISDEHEELQNCDPVVAACQEFCRVTGKRLKNVIHKFHSDEYSLPYLYAPGYGIVEKNEISSFLQSIEDENPMNELQVYAHTWNVYGKYKQSLDIVHLPDLQQDILIFGFQELLGLKNPLTPLRNSSVLKAWEMKIRNSMASSSMYSTICSKVMVGLGLLVMVKSTIASRISSISSYCQKLDLRETYGSKGAILLSFKYEKAMYCVVCAHLAPHIWNMKERVRQMYHVLHIEMNSRHVIDHDYLFLLGDLNIRRDSESKSADLSIDLLVNEDQFVKHNRRLYPFSRLFESEITFKPTYKIKKNLGIYNSKRVPSYTDRIFAACLTKGGIQAKNYESYNYIGISDHYPVSCEFTVRKENYRSEISHRVSCLFQQTCILMRHLLGCMKGIELQKNERNNALWMGWNTVESLVDAYDGLWEETVVLMDKALEERNKNRTYRKSSTWILLTGCLSAWQQLFSQSSSKYLEKRFLFQKQDEKKEAFQNHISDPKVKLWFERCELDARLKSDTTTLHDAQFFDKAFVGGRPDHIVTSFYLMLFGFAVVSAVMGVESRYNKNSKLKFTNS